MKNQVLPAWVRVLVGIFGLALVGAGIALGEQSLILQVLLIGSGLLLIVSGAWGMRRSVGTVLRSDSKFGPADVAAELFLEGIIGGIEAIFD